MNLFIDAFSSDENTAEMIDRAFVETVSIALNRRVTVHEVQSLSEKELDPMSVSITPTTEQFPVCVQLRDDVVAAMLKTGYGSSINASRKHVSAQMSSFITSPEDVKTMTFSDCIVLNYCLTNISGAMLYYRGIVKIHDADRLDVPCVELITEQPEVHDGDNWKLVIRDGKHIGYVNCK